MKVNHPSEHQILPKTAKVYEALVTAVYEALVEVAHFAAPDCDFHRDFKYALTCGDTKTMLCIARKYVECDQLVLIESIYTEFQIVRSWEIVALDHPEISF